MKCIYCASSWSEMTVVQQAIKPKHSPHRWSPIGHCCDKCEAEGKPVRLEFAPEQHQARDLAEKRAARKAAG